MKPGVGTSSALQQQHQGPTPGSEPPTTAASHHAQAQRQHSPAHPQPQPHHREQQREQPRGAPPPGRHEQPHPAAAPLALVDTIDEYDHAGGLQFVDPMDAQLDAIAGTNVYHHLRRGPD